jgi:hypothetical protein
MIMILSLSSALFSEEKQYLEKIKKRLMLIKTSSGTGTGFILDNGFIVTAQHVIGNATRVYSIYNNVEYIISPIYKDAKKDLAILYVSEYKSGDSWIEFSDKTFRRYVEMDLKFQKEIDRDEDIIAVGHPYGVSEVKRIFGKYKYVNKKNGLLACDLPVIKGMSGGPVINLKDEVVGIATSFELEPTGTEYLVSYMNPIHNIQRVLQEIDMSTLERVEKIRDLSGIASFDLDDDHTYNVRPRQKFMKNYLLEYNDYYEQKIIKSIDIHSVFETSDSYSRLNAFFDFFMMDAINDKARFQIYPRYVDEDNYVLFEIDLKSGVYQLTYRVKGKDQEKSIERFSPVYEDYFYNFEFYLNNNNIIFYFDNIPVYFSTDIPFDEGKFRFSSDNCNIFIKNFYLRKRVEN